MKKRLLFTLPLLAISIFAFAQTLGTTFRISANSSAVGGNAASGLVSISPNGARAVYSSRANNLVTGDTNTSEDIFIVNPASGGLNRVNLGNLGQEANDNSTSPSVSFRTPNGFLVVVYESDATNLIRFPVEFPDNNNKTDIYFTIPTLNITERVTMGIGPTQANGGSFNPSVAIVPEPNRILVAYASEATNLIQSDTNSARDIFLTTISNSDKSGFSFSNDLSTARVSVPDGDPTGHPNGDSRRPALSGNGKFVVYESVATNLTPGVIPQAKQIYLYDIEKQRTVLVSKNASGEPGNAESERASVSFSGNFVVYLTSATNIVSDGQIVQGDALQVMRYNVKTGVTERVNINSSGQLGNGNSLDNMSAVISADGRSVIFSDRASNLVANDNNNAADVFLRDMNLGTITRLSQGVGGTDTDAFSTDPSIAGASFTSLTVFSGFTSLASNLISGDSEGRIDAFLTSATLPKPLFKKNAPIEVPADITLDGKKLVVEGQKFSTAKLKSLVTTRATAKPTLQFRYEVRSDNPTGKNSLRRIISKKNKVSFKDLPAGTYKVKYRSEVIKNDKITSKSQFSPEDRVTVG